MRKIFLILGFLLVSGIANAALLNSNTYYYTLDQVAVVKSTATANVPINMFYHRGAYSVVDDTFTVNASDITKYVTLYGTGTVHTQRLEATGVSNLDGLLTCGTSVYVTLDCSALTFTDRTPYPKDKKEAYDSVLSMSGKNGKVEHKKLHKSLQSNIIKERWDPVNKVMEQYTEHGRNLSATVSALIEVIKDLMQRIDKLEKN